MESRARSGLRLEPDISSELEVKRVGQPSGVLLVAAMGEMLAAASPAEAERMLAGLPAPIKLIWRLVGRRKYERSITMARG